MPLRGFKGQRELLALGLTAATLEDTGLRLFESRPQEAVALLDLRAFRQETTVWTALGIVEARKTDQLRFDFAVQQLLLVTRLNPWVYIAAGVREADHV